MEFVMLRYLQSKRFDINLITFKNWNNMTVQKLGIGSDFPKIILKDIDNNSITIPDDIKSKYCILLFIRGAWWPKCSLQLEGYRKHNLLFESLGASIVTASVDTADEMRLVAEGKCFPKREKAMPFTVCHGVTHEISKTVGAFCTIMKKEKTKIILLVKAKIICSRQNLLLTAPWKKLFFAHIVTED